MMYNFLDPKLLPKVTTKCPSMEGYEVENLISSDYLVKLRGFIAYTTMKPPVDVEFQLICNISLSYIIISSRIGSHKCSSVEVLVKNANLEFVPICKVTYKENGIIFCNSRYYSKIKPPATHNDYYLAFFRANEFRSFINTNTVKIRILATSGTVPCLAGVEIWGNISKSCSHETAKTVHSLMNKSEKSILTNNINDINKTSREMFEIPDDFKDALTYELMAIPMTLPSGHTIDQSTLEKCLATDASCGRHGCDPFTGLMYLEKRKPILNMALKTRIDMFLLENCHQPELYTAKRTLGKIKTYPVQSVTHSQQHNITQDYSDICHTSKKIKLGCDTNNANLEDAINKALNNSDFIRFSSASVSENKPINNCVVCQSNGHLYILPCRHLYCRNCLLNTENMTNCKDCGVEFLKNVVKRYHF